MAWHLKSIPPSSFVTTTVMQEFMLSVHVYMFAKHMHTCIEYFCGLTLAITKESSYIIHRCTSWSDCGHAEHLVWVNGKTKILSSRGTSFPAISTGFIFHKHRRQSNSDSKNTTYHPSPARP